MSGLRLWVSILAVVSFLAGLAAGLVVGEYSRKAPAEDRFFGDFERRFVEHFDLDAERQSQLAELLRLHVAELEAIKHSHTEELDSQMESEFRDVGLEYRKLIRDRLLTARERPEFNRLMASYDANY